MDKDTTINDLAGMVQKGFEGVDKRFDAVDKRFERMERQMVILEDGQEQIKLRLDNVAYRFELNDLEKRVQLLEKKAGVKN